MLVPFVHWSYGPGNHTQGPSQGMRFSQISVLRSIEGCYCSPLLQYPCLVHASFSREGVLDSDILCTAQPNTTSLPQKKKSDVQSAVGQVQKDSLKGSTKSTMNLDVSSNSLRNLFGLSYARQLPFFIWTRKPYARALLHTACSSESVFDRDKFLRMDYKVTTRG